MNRDFMRWMRDVWKKRKRKTPHFKLSKVEAPPKKLKKNTIYVIGDEECIWTANILCPCGCGDIIHLNLVGDTSPSWRLRQYKDGDISLYPSVWRTVGCRSHFIIYRSKLFWCDGL